MGGLCANVGGDGSGGSGNGSPYPMSHGHGMMLPPPTGAGWTMPSEYSGIGHSFGSHSMHDEISPSSSSPPLHPHMGQLRALMGVGSTCSDGCSPSTVAPQSSHSTNAHINSSWGSVHDTKDNIVISNCGTVANNDKNNEDEDRKPDISSND